MMKSYKIIQGNCIATTEKLEKESIDLSVFSPPYDNIRDYKKGWVFDYKALGKNLYTITKVGGVCAVIIGDGTKNFAKSLTTFKLAVNWCEIAGWRLFETCIYQRDGNLGVWWNSRFNCFI